MKDLNKNFDQEEKEYIYWLIFRKDKVRHIGEDILSKLNLSSLEDYQHDGIITKWDTITKEKNQ